MPRPIRRPYKELSLQQLRTFAVVCREGGYAAAARTLLLTSPAVWEQMQALERHYGVPLLERHGNGVQPTPQGLQLLDMVRPILSGIDSTREVLHQQAGVAPKELIFTTDMRVLVDQVSEGLQHFHLRYPGVRLHVRYTGNDEIAPRMLRGDSDVTLTLEPRPDVPLSAAIEYEPAGETDYLLVMPAGHPLANKRTLKLHAILQYPLVLAEPETYSRRRVQEVLHRYDLIQEARIVAETSSDIYTLSCVRNGMGIGITVGIPRGPLYEKLETRSMRRWFGTARYGFFWMRGTHVPPVTRQLADAIRQEISLKRTADGGPARLGGQG